MIKILIVSGIILSFNASFAQVVASIGNEKKITKAEFDQKYKQVLEQAVINRPSPGDFLEDLVRYELGLIEAKKRKLDKDPLVIDRMNQELYKALLEKEIGPKTRSMEKTLDKDMRSWYEKNPEIRTSHILIQHRVDAPQEEIQAAQKRASEILKEVKNSKRPFSELVKLYSDDTLSKQAGGDVGWQSRLTLVPEYYNVAVSLKPNQLSNLVKTPFGFHIVKLTGKRSYENANKEQIRAALFEVKRRELFDAFFVKLKSEHEVKVNKKLVE